MVLIACDKNNYLVVGILFTLVFLDFAEVAEMNLEIEIVNVQALKGQSCNMPY